MIVILDKPSTLTAKPNICTKTVLVCKDQGIELTCTPNILKEINACVLYQILYFFYIILYYFLFLYYFILVGEITFYN